MREDLLRLGIQFHIRVILGLKHHRRQAGTVPVRLGVVDQRRTAAAGPTSLARRGRARRR